MKQWNKEECIKYWENMTDESNMVKKYAVETHKSRELARFLQEYLNPKDSIIELGCNCGRNISILREYGFSNIIGVEINKVAIDFGKKHFQEENIIHSEIGEFLKNHNQKYDLIFTMAVLEHIPDVYSIIKDIERLSQKYILVIEDEKDIGLRHFPRNYKKLFSWKQIKFKRNLVSWGLNKKFRLRLFKNKI